MLECLGTVAPGAWRPTPRPPRGLEASEGPGALEGGRFPGTLRRSGPRKGCWEAPRMAPDRVRRPWEALGGSERPRSQDQFSCGPPEGLGYLILRAT